MLLTLFVTGFTKTDQNVTTEIQITYVTGFAKRGLIRAS